MMLDPMPMLWNHAMHATSLQDAPAASRGARSGASDPSALKRYDQALFYPSEHDIHFCMSTQVFCDNRVDRSTLKRKFGNIEVSEVMAVDRNRQ